ncbi:MAG: FHA domain-containing protein [Acidobacteria bacterium]|nr:FHA domain-containing protein [Acidobacteriota bacterium]
MEHIVLRHVSGSRAKEEDIFKLADFKEITLGRELSSSVRFGDDEEFMVSRHHARIIQNPALPSLFLITDLNSINGTFVNDQRINGTYGLKKGDLVRLGLGGPVFRFDIEPRSELIADKQAPAPTVNLMGVPPPKLAQPNIPSATPPSEEHVASADKAVGSRAQAAVSNQASRSRSGRGVLVLMMIFALSAGVLIYRSYGSEILTWLKNRGGSQPKLALTDADVGKYGHVHLSGVDTAEVEKDTQRAAWRLDVQPYLVLGTGHPGNSASDFDKPDGVAFSAKGLLFATDAGNRRVHVWNVKSGARLGEFGRNIFEGAIVDIAVRPDNMVLITDQILNFAYAFMPPQPGALDDKGNPLGPYDYQFKGIRFGELGIKKLGGIASDSKARVYAVDTYSNDVLRFNLDGKADKTWKFEKLKADGDTYLHGSGGIAIDEAANNLLIASEKDAVIEVFDWETGAYKNQFVGAAKDSSGKPTGKNVFYGSVEGLAITRNHLLAVDESAAHIQIFDLSKPDAFNTDLVAYSPPQPRRAGGYRGFFGHAPLVDFEDKTNLELHNQVKTGSTIPGKANPPGYFCSPDSIASYTDQATGESFIAIADRCNYRVVVYRWSDVSKAMGDAPTLAMNNPKPVTRPAIKPVVKGVKRPVPKAAASSNRVASRPVVTKPARNPPADIPVIPNPVVEKGKKKKKKKNKNQSEFETETKKEKKAKKEKKLY